MKANRQPKLNPLASFFMLSMVITMLSSGAFGLVPNSPFKQQYLDLVANNIPLELLTPANQFLEQIGAPTISKDRLLDQKTPLDPGGWILAQFGANLPPMGADTPNPILDPGGWILTQFGVDLSAISSDTPNAISDPAGTILEIFGVETDTLPEPEISRDPIGEFAALFDIELKGSTDIDIAPLLDPGGDFLSLFIQEEYLYPPETPYNPLMDPGGIFLGLFVPQDLLGPAQPDPFLVYNNFTDPIGIILGESPSSGEIATTPEVDIFSFFALVFPIEPVDGYSSTNNNNAPVGLLFNLAPTQVYPTSSLAAAEATSSPVFANTVASSTTTVTLSATAQMPIYVYATATQAGSGGGSALPTPTPSITPSPTPIPTSAIVNSTNDPGVDGICNATECTLREAVSALISGGTITFDPAIYGSTITLSSLISINNSITISGSGSNMTIDGNSSTPMFAVNTGNVSISGLRLSNGLNAGGNGGAIIFNGGNLTVYLCSFSGNTGSNGGAIYHISTGYLSVSNSTFFNNVANFNGGAIYESGNGQLFVQNSRFTSNSSTWDGAGIYSIGGTVVDIQNSIFIYNTTSTNGGAILFGGGTPQLRNSTLWSNSATGAGGGIYNGADLSMWNNILWNNSAPSGSQIFDAGGAVMGNNNIQGNGVSGSNIDSDPMFVSIADPLNLRLSPGSPSIDSGDNAKCTASSIDGVTRPINICDMGAYEQ